MPLPLSKLLDYWGITATTIRGFRSRLHYLSNVLNDFCSRIIQTQVSFKFFKDFLDFAGYCQRFLRFLKAFQFRFYKCVGFSKFLQIFKEFCDLQDFSKLCKIFMDLNDF